MSSVETRSEWPKAESMHHTEGQDMIICSKGDNGTHFQTVCPQKHLRMINYVKNENENFKEVQILPTLCTPGQSMHGSGSVIGKGVSDSNKHLV